VQIIFSHAQSHRNRVQLLRRHRHGAGAIFTRAGWVETGLEKDFIGCNDSTVEYVVVTFPKTRTVILDGDPGGITGAVLLVEKGTHRFQLDGPQDYTPKWRQSVVKNTTFASPMELSFEIIEGLRANSLETVGVVMAVEEEFGHQIADDNDESLLSAGDMFKHVKKLPTDTAPEEKKVEIESEFYSVFISYSHEDKAFAHMLHDRLQGQGIRGWVDEHEMLPGDDLHEGIDRGIQLWDKVLLCASKSSLTSWWVDGEISRAFQKEAPLMKERGKKILALIPLNLDGFLFSDEYQSGKKTEIKSRVAANFVGWEKDPALFDRELGKVIRALRTEDAGRKMPPVSRL
jgi:acyl carrier protein